MFISLLSIPFIRFENENKKTEYQYYQENNDNGMEIHSFYIVPVYIEKIGIWEWNSIPQRIHRYKKAELAGSDVTKIPPMESHYLIMRMIIDVRSSS